MRINELLNAEKWQIYFSFPVVIMRSFVKKCFLMLRPPSREEKEATRAKEEETQSILRAELGQTRIDGKAISHRRLETLMLASNTDRKTAIRLLRKLGARPSKSRGAAWWTLDQG